MDMGIKDKVAVVTGASKGIGLAVAKALAAEGARVVAGSRTSNEGLEALRQQYDLLVVPVDLARPEGPDELVAQAIREYGGVDLLVNNVGGMAGNGTPGPRAGFLAVDDADWHATFELNFFSAVRASRAALPSMLERGGGAIVNVSSANARLPFPMVVDYSAAKAAMTNLTKALSEEFAPKGVRVNTVSPGPVRTPLWTDPGGMADTVARTAGVDRDAAINEVIPKMFQLSLGRFAEAEEVADLVLFLLSPRAGATTGSDYAIDSGVIKTV